MTAPLCSFPTSTIILLPDYSSMPPQTFLHLLCTHLLTPLLINLNPILFVHLNSNLLYSPRRSPSNPTHRYCQPLPPRSCSSAAPPIFPSLYALLTLDVSRPPFTLAHLAVARCKMRDGRLENPVANRSLSSAFIEICPTLIFPR